MAVIGWSEATSFFSVVAIDVALAGDNALVVGMAAAGLPSALRTRAVLVGIIAATLLRLVFSIFVLQLLQVVGLTAAGGLLLIWVAWKLWREAAHAPAPEGSHDAAAAPGQRKTLRQAVLQIVVADLSMSLDNVLAVAGAARDHLEILILGLCLSLALMGFAASLIARMVTRHRWIVYLGILIIVYVALSMIWAGSHEILRSFAGAA